ncbi:facilitated trehalose transporter Tret1 [Folsomia candida]|uniref:facilitated trehalose transporter Tret1 n=1 Tax=Folsomia candida TaxID=158441 RepID=UPI00160531DE|nr:facilitated trehalose transporter Tret1 [Folsomia candida]
MENARMDALTYTCADTYAPSHLPDTIIHQGATANKAEDAKKKKYAFLMDRFIFVPVAMETSGGFASEGLSFLREVGRRIGAREKDLVIISCQIGAAVACPVIGLLSRQKGLRFSMLFPTIPLIVGWFLIGFAYNLEMLMFGRFITGFCSGGLALTAPAFVAEIAVPSIRGTLSYAYFFNFSCGILYMFTIGSVTSYQLQSCLSILPPILFFLLMMFIPESPKYLVENGKTGEAIKSLMWFRMAETPELVKNELKKLEDATLAKKDILVVNEVKFCRRETVHPILIAGMLQTLLQACGELPVIFYTVEIFESAGCQNGNVGTILVGVTQIIVIAISSLFIDRFGRKPLLIGSEVLMAVCLIGLGCFLYLKEIYVGSVENYGWFPIISLVGFIAAFAMGIGPIPFLVIGEVIAPEDKGMSSAVIIIG